MLVNLYFYNMDSQLSLFGFEEPVAPQPAKTTSKKNVGQVDGKEEMGDNEPQQEDLFANTIEAETPILADEASEAEPILENPVEENELNEIIVPNQETATVEMLLQKDNFDYPSEEEYAEMKEALADSDSDQDETFSDISIVDEFEPELEPNENLLDHAIVEGLDEVAIPNQEVQTIDEQLEEETHEYPIAEETIIEENHEPAIVSADFSFNTEPVVEKPIETEIEDENPTLSNIIEPLEETEPVEPVAQTIPEETQSPFVNSFGKKGRKSFKEIDAEVDLISVPSDDVLFSKQYYPISQVAKWFRVNNSLLRFWENEFDILKPRKNRKGDRLFRPEDIKNLQIIYYLLRQKKYTIAGARKYIKNNRKAVDTNMKIVQTLNDFKKFLLELKVNSDR